MEHVAHDLDADDRELAAARDDLERRIRTGALLGAEDLRESYPAIWCQPDKVLELVYTEYVLRVANGETPDRNDWYRRYPDWRDRLERLFGLNDLLTGHDTHRNQHDATIAEGNPLRSPGEEPDHPDGYELFEELGRGGMAVVYRARHLDLNRIVALKVLRGGAWFRDEDAVRIRREAEAAARLQHPNIVQIHEIGDWDGVPFLALEYVAGGTLAEFLTTSQRHGTLGLTPPQAAELIETLARAMHHAHSQGVVHRDLKPANVLLAVGSGQWAVSSQDDTRQGPTLLPTAHRSLPTVKIADFGLAVSLHVSPVVTQTAALAGTPCYMAPEQANAQREAIGPRTDVYALGGVLYELLTGRPPFQGATVLETLELVRQTEPVAPRQLRPQVPRDLETICLKCLQKAPEKRYSSALALAEDLERFRTGRPITARPVSALERGWKWCRRRPQTTTLLAALAVAIVAAVGLPSHYWQQAEQAREAEAWHRQQAELRTASLLIATARLQWRDHDLPAARESLTTCDESYRNDEWRYLARACRAPIQEMQWSQPRNPNSDMAVALAFSPDGNSLGASLRGSAIKTWNPHTGLELLVAPKGPILRADFHHPIPGEALINASAVSTTAKSLVLRFDLSNGTWKTVWEGTGLTQLRTSCDGRYAAYLRQGKIYLVELRTGTTRSLATFDTRTSRYLEFTPNGQRLVIQSDHPEVQLFDVVPGTLAFTVPVPVETETVIVAAVSPDGERIAYKSTRFGRASNLIIRERSRPDVAVKITTGVKEILRAEFSPDGTKIAAHGSEGGHVGVWDVGTGREVILLQGHWGRAQCIRFSPDSQRLAVGCTEARITIWDVRPE